MERISLGHTKNRARFRPIYFRRDQELTQLVETSGTPTRGRGVQFRFGAVLQHFANPTWGASILRTDVKAGFLSRRDNRTEPGVLTPGTDKKTSRPEGGGRSVVSDLCRRSPNKAPIRTSCAPSGRQPATRVQFGFGAELQHSARPQAHLSSTRTSTACPP
jgi:hypothetical protein